MTSTGGRIGRIKEEVCTQATLSSSFFAHADFSPFSPTAEPGTRATFFLVCLPFLVTHFSQLWVALKECVNQSLAGGYREDF